MAQACSRRIAVLEHQRNELFNNRMNQIVINHKYETSVRL
jgi:hypothetical protein